MKKILIANRGEIALRVMRSAREMGIKTVAVYSDIDRNAPYVKYADEAIHIGKSQSSQSYLVIDKIIAACKTSGADGVHPGYGFLSENAEFARRLTKENITLIGPSPEAMEVMGDKLSAKAAVKNYNIPMIPGTAEALIDVIEGKEIARGIGYPILIKASAGGGGKGMRVVENEEEFEEQMKTANFLRIFIAHGNEDRMVEFESSLKARDLLTKLGYDVTYVEFGGGHTVDKTTLQTAEKWMKE